MATISAREKQVDATKREASIIWRSLVQGLDVLPVMSAVLGPLIRYLELPPDQIEIEKVTEFIARDNSIAAQCLRAANSALFARPRSVESLRGAVVALGSARLRGIIWTSFLRRLTGKEKGPLDASAFWKHAFACALFSERVAKMVGLPDSDKAYLCGLLHDVGAIVNSAILPKEFEEVMVEARRSHDPLRDVETRLLGFTHADSGRMLADRWSLPVEVAQVIEFHHAPDKAPGQPFVAIVNLSDVLCHSHGLGHGYDERCDVEFLDAPGWSVLKQCLPHMVERLDMAHVADEIGGEIAEVEQMAASVFGN